MLRFKFMRASALGLALTGLACMVAAQSVQVEQAWTRATVPGQQAGGAFMTLTASEDVQLVGGSSPVAGITEIHEMVMDGDVMRMRALDELALPAGQAVALKPGGLHVMFMQLKQPLTEGSQVPLTLQLRNSQGQPFELSVEVPVHALTAAHGASGHGDHGDHGKHQH